MGISNPDASLARVFRFGSVGAASSALYFILASAITFALPGREMLASITAYSACITFSFILQRNFAFRSSGTIRFEFLRFSLVSGLGLILSTAIVFVAVSYYGISPVGSYVIVVATIPFISYLLMSRFVFLRTTKSMQPGTKR